MFTNENPQFSLYHDSISKIFNAMKLSLLFILCVAFVGSCNHANLFSPAEGEKNQTLVDGPSGQTVIEMQTTGGFAGVNEQLLIDANRFLRFSDQSGQMETVLAAEEHSRLIALFIEKDFLHMNSSYVDDGIADAFHFRIVFRYSGSEKEVATDYFAAPTELKALVDNLRGLIEGLRRQSLALELKTSAETLRHGETLTLTLTATNRNAAPITLQTGGQKFDFFVLPGGAVTAPTRSSSVIWNWAYDKVFIAIVEAMTFQPGESRTYTVEWDGRNNNGDLVEGEFWLCARLVARPGGYSPLQRVVVTKSGAYEIQTAIIPVSELQQNVISDTTRIYAYFGQQPAKPDSLLQALCASGISVTQAWLPLDGRCENPIGPRFTVELTGADNRIEAHGFKRGFGYLLLCATQLKKFTIVR
jgi:hypothetical protein